ncbi:MASE1 domain-containing protein [Enterobacter asburiae]|uniref:MASE1 domain-containing protein n=1 Tax=Scandinavium sp. UTDF21-P1B TaxID=3446379 RepID=UPI00347C68AE
MKEKVSSFTTTRLTITIAFSMLLWGMLYFATGYLSLRLDDPVSRVAFVWFPAGVAVSAFLLTRHSYWPLLFSLFFLVRTLLDLYMRHHLPTSLILSAVSLGGDLLIAWYVHRFSRPGDDLNIILIWISATLVFSLLAAILGVGWLALHSGLPFLPTVWIWWSANVTGTLAVTIILMGFLRKKQQQENAGNQRWRHLTGAVLWILLVLSGWFAFDREIGVGSMAGAYALALIPLVLAIVQMVICGNRSGSFAFLSLSIIVIYYSWQGYGPFFIHGLRAGEPLLLAQCYLTAIALLLAFIRVLTHSVKNTDTVGNQLHDQQVIYHLNTSTGQMVWNSELRPPLDILLAGIDSREQLLSRVHPEDSASLQARWDAALAGQPQRSLLTLRLALPDKQWLSIIDREAIALKDSQGNAIIGYWLLNRYRQ